MASLQKNLNLCKKICIPVRKPLQKNCGGKEKLTIEWDVGIG
jgi:hypothetical protein